MLIKNAVLKVDLKNSPVKAYLVTSYGSNHMYDYNEKEKLISDYGDKNCELVICHKDLISGKYLVEFLI